MFVRPCLVCVHGLPVTTVALRAQCAAQQRKNTLYYSNWIKTKRRWTCWDALGILCAVKMMKLFFSEFVCVFLDFYVFIWFIHTHKDWEETQQTFAVQSIRHPDLSVLDISGSPSLLHWARGLFWAVLGGLCGDNCLRQQKQVEVGAGLESGGYSSEIILWIIPVNNLTRNVYLGVRCLLSVIIF